MNSFRKRILFVAPNLVGNEELQSQIAGINPRWNARFAEDGKEALGLISADQFDAIVSDSALTDMEGQQLLDMAQEKQPAASRVLVSELSDSSAALKYVGTAHHCVPKPWDADILRVTLERIFALGIWLSNNKVRELVARMKIVPSPPDLYFEIVKALQSPNVDLESVAERVSRDPAITAKLLQLVNSATMGLRRRVLKVQEAINYVGFETTRSLILLAHTFSYCDRTRVAGFSMEQLWQHSLATGLLARKIASAENENLVEECFLAGLLHDIGKLLLAVNLGFDYGGVLGQARQKKIHLWEAELDHYGATHAEIGAELLAIWHLPLSVVEAVALHHYPSKVMSSGFSPLTAVHVSNIFEQQTRPSEHGEEIAEIDMQYLADVGLNERLEAWHIISRDQLQPVMSD